MAKPIKKTGKQKQAVPAKVPYKIWLTVALLVFILIIITVKVVLTPSFGNDSLAFQMFTLFLYCFTFATIIGLIFKRGFILGIIYALALLFTSPLMFQINATDAILMIIFGVMIIILIYDQRKWFI